MDSELIKNAQRKLAPVSRQAASEGIVLLKNEFNSLPIKLTDKVSIFGRCQVDTYRSGTGSGGAVNVPYSVSILEGIRANTAINLNEDLAANYESWVKVNPLDDGGGGWAAEPRYQHEMPLDLEVIATAAACSNKAIIVVGRTAGEDQDNTDEPGSYRLTNQEFEMIAKVTRSFLDVTIVMNVTNIIDMSWIENIVTRSSIKSVLYMWAAGMEGGHALADVLSGDVSPSGRLTDTIAYDIKDYPSSENFGSEIRNLYQEDIYLGYRYFETFNPEAVQYEFGAGLSYTSFHQRFKSLTLEGDGADSVLRFLFQVTNVGKQFSGKEVVQLYVEAPQGNLGKPHRALIGFAKTSLLAPGETQEIFIIVNAADMASYDDGGSTGFKSAYVLESGKYRFHFGSSVRNTQQCTQVFECPSDILVKVCQESLAPTFEFKRVKPKRIYVHNRYTVSYEPVPQRTVSMFQRINENLPTSYPITGDMGFKLLDVRDGKVSIEEFIAQLSAEQLATIVRGEGMCSPKVTPGTAAAFGGISDSLFQLGLPTAAAVDGPSGIRMDSGHIATQVPIGTLLGCTWNAQLNRDLFSLIGQEMRAYEIDVLLGPGINIHRHPLNGRNFEYFSEDPFLTGTLATAQILGLKQAGVSGTIKHFAANDQESARMDVDSVMSERVIREVHIKPFEMAVKLGGANAIMSSYNPINGHWGASNYDLNTTVLREEWGFEGIVMTDWWAKMNDPIDGGKADKTYTSCMIKAQNDLYMVVENYGGDINAAGDDTLAALSSGKISLGELQRSAMNICRFILDTPLMDRHLKRHEPIKTLRSCDRSFGDKAVKVAGALKIDTDKNMSMSLEVLSTGCYQVVSTLNYDRLPLAQSSCSLTFNDEFAMSFATNGTEGQTIQVEGLKIILEKGFYQLDIDFVKPGLKLEQLEFFEIS